jgi:hypothetical protein
VSEDGLSLAAIDGKTHSTSAPSDTQPDLDPTLSVPTATAGSPFEGERDSSPLDEDEDLFVFPAADTAARLTDDHAGSDEQRLREKFNARLVHCMMLGEQAAEAEAKVAKDAEAKRKALEEGTAEVLAAMRSVYSLAKSLMNLRTEALRELLEGASYVEADGKQKKLKWSIDIEKNPALGLCTIAFSRLSRGERSKRSTVIHYGQVQDFTVRQFIEWYAGEHTYGDNKTGKGKAAAYNEAKEFFDTASTGNDVNSQIEKEGNLLLKRQPLFQLEIGPQQIEPGWLTGLRMHVDEAGRALLFGPSSRAPIDVLKSLKKANASKTDVLGRSPLRQLIRSIMIADELLNPIYVQRQHALTPEQPRHMLVRKNTLDSIDIVFAYQKARPNLSMRITGGLDELPTGQAFVLDIDAQAALVKATKGGHEVRLVAPSATGQGFRFEFGDSSVILHHSQAIKHPLHISREVPSQDWPVQFVFDRKVADQFRCGLKQAETFYGKERLRNRSLNRPIVWDAAWDKSNNDLRLEISFGTAGSVSVSIGSKPHMPHNLDYQSYSAKEIDRICSLIQNGGLDETFATMYDKTLVFGASEGDIEFEYKIPALRKYSYDPYSTDQLHTDFKWWGSEPQWHEVKEKVVTASRKPAIAT